MSDVQTMTDDPIINEVFRVEQQRFDAITSNNAQALELLLAADMRYVHANGVVEDKTELLRKMTSGERIYRRFSCIRHEGRREAGVVFVFGEVRVEVNRAIGLLCTNITYSSVYRTHPAPIFFLWHATKLPEVSA